MDKNVYNANNTTDSSHNNNNNNNNNNNVRSVKNDKKGHTDVSLYHACSE